MSGQHVNAQEKKQPAIDVPGTASVHDAARNGGDRVEQKGESVASSLATAHPPAAPVTEKRRKTWGEHLFNWTTYGGFALLGNELAATAIVQQKDKANWIGDAYRRGESFLKGVGKPGALKYIQGRMNYINFAIIGGMLMVPFIKLLEDNKGRLVRAADIVVYGTEAQTDPKIVAAHAEMDQAPRQSWGSLLKGRLLTVAMAYTVDSTVGWREGFLARQLKGTRFEKISSLDHLSKFFAEMMSNLFKVKTEPTRTMLQRGSELLTLSTALTILFYASSKFFAARREERSQREMAIHELEQAGVIPRHHFLLDTANPSTQVEQNVAELSDKPPNKIRNAVAEPSRVQANEVVASPA